MSCGAMHEFALVLDKAGFDATLVQEVVNSKGNKMAKTMFDALKPITISTETTPAELEPSLVLKINRNKYFNSIDTFPGLTIWKGTVDKFDLEGQDEQDKRSLTISEIDFAKVNFKHHLLGKEPYITGEVALTRAKESGEIRLDPAIGESLWLDYETKKKKSVLEAIFLTKKVKWFELLTPLCGDSIDSRCTLCFYRDGSRWHRSYNWLKYNRTAGNVSASLVS